MTKRPSVLDYKKYGAQLDKNLVEMALKTPGEYKPSIESSEEIEKFNQTPRSTGETVVQGLFSGIRAGMKKADQDKTMRVLEWFQQNAMADKQQNDWHMQKEQEREMLAPYAMTALELAYSGGQYGDVDNNMRNVWNQLKSNNPDIQGEYMGFIPNSGIINIRTPDGNIVPHNVGQYVGDDTLKRVQTGYLQKQALSVNQQRADDYGRNVASNIAYNKAQINKINNPQISSSGLSEKEQKSLINEMNDLEAAVKEYEVFDSAEQLLYEKDEKGNIKFNKKTGEPILSNKALQGGITQALLDETPNFLKNPDQALFSTLSSDAKGRHFKQMGYRNETEYKNIRTISPRLDAKSNLAIAQSQKERLRPAVERYNQIKNQLNGNPEDVHQPQAVKNNDSNSIDVIAPDGTSGRMPIANLKAALEQGFKLA